MIVPPASTFALHYMIGKVSIFGIVYSVQFPIWLSPCLDSTEIQSGCLVVNIASDVAPSGRFNMSRRPVSWYRAIVRNKLIVAYWVRI